jgi:hypothetical protein
MSRIKELLEDEYNVAINHIDDEYRYEQYNAREREIVSSRTLKVAKSTDTLNELFKSFADIFGGTKQS